MMHSMSNHHISDPSMNAADLVLLFFQQTDRRLILWSDNSHGKRTTLAPVAVESAVERIGG